jgi:hypothetical protein
MPRPDNIRLVAAVGLHVSMVSTQETIPRSLARSASVHADLAPHGRSEGGGTPPERLTGRPSGQCRPVPAPNQPRPLSQGQTGALAARRVQKASASLEVERGDRGRPPRPVPLAERYSPSAKGAKRRLDEVSNRHRGGRPRLRGALRALIRRMSAENPLWGSTSSRHGDLRRPLLHVSADRGVIRADRSMTCRRMKFWRRTGQEHRHDRLDSRVTADRGRTGAIPIGRAI